MSDLIRRADAIKAIEDLPNAYNGWSDAYDKAYVIGTLEEVPTVEPKRGEWIFHSEWEEHWCRYECSLCGRTFDYEMNYCGFCGCRMKGAGDE